MEQNRQLQAMQEEHRQLLQEMETLRLRAEELSRLTGQQRSATNKVADSTPTENMENTAEQAAETLNQKAEELGRLNERLNEMSSQVTETSTNIQTEEVKEMQQTSSKVEVSETKTEKVTEITETSNKTEEVKSSQQQNDDEDPEQAEYIRQKLAEIAQLKSQFKRVQHMINTTNLIEQHIETKEKQAELQKNIESKKSSSISGSTTSSQTAVSNSAGTMVCPEIPADLATRLNSQAHSENEELLSAMLTMFTDFSSDLRGQAESLRAERERIRLLKEELLQRRKSSK